MSDAPLEIDPPDAEPETTKRSVIDLNDIFAEELAAAAAEASTVKATINILGREWDLVEPANDFNNIAASNFEQEPHRILRIMTDLVHPDQRIDFSKALAALPAIKTTTILKLFTAMSEAVAGRPTQPSKPSRPGRVTPRSTKSSTAS